MQLTQAQIEQFDRDGYLFFPSLFTPEESQVLLDEVPHLYAQRRPENVREKGSEAVRSNFGADMYCRSFARLGRHHSWVDPVVLIFGERVRKYTVKCSANVGLTV